MKNKLIIMGIAILLILTNAVAVYAATATIELVVDKTEVKCGETFTVTLKATCDDGINGVITKYAYDTEKLELVSANVADNRFLSLGTDNAIELMVNTSDTITSADIYTLTFKVKDGVSANTTAQISIEETELDTFSATNPQATVEAQIATIKIIEEQKQEPEIPTDPEQPETPPAENDKPTTPEQETVPGTTVVIGGDKKDETVSDKNLPNTGVNVIVITSAIVVSIVIAIILYKKIKEYQFIK